MRRIGIIRAAPLVALLLIGALSTPAGPAIANDSHSWHVAAGWDNGLSVRARLYHGWAFGLHYQHDGSSRIIGPQLGFPDQWNEYGLILYGDFPLFETLSVGPFAEFILAKDNINLFDIEAYGTIAGIRPSVRLFNDRFLLETRLGIEIVRVEDLPWDDGHEVFTDPYWDEWQVGPYGDNIGLNSRLTFMILF